MNLMKLAESYMLKLNICLKNWVAAHGNRNDNISKRFKNIRKEIVSVIIGITRHQRIAATHVLVFLISNEERRKNHMQYLRIQCIPYKSLSDFKVRELANLIIGKMTGRKMKVAGTYM